LAADARLHNHLLNVDSQQQHNTLGGYMTNETTMLGVVREQKSHYMNKGLMVCY